MNEAMKYDYRQILHEHYLIRREFNPRYSLRAFANDLGMRSANLSNLLNGKQGLSYNSAIDLAKKLKLKGSEESYFIDLVLASDARSKKEKILARGRLCEASMWDKKNIQEDYFRLISEWYYFTILELLHLDDFKSDHSWIAEQLGIEKTAVDKAMARLLRLNLIEDNNGIYKSTGVELNTSFDIPSHSLKKYHMQIFNRASEALLNQDVLDREMTNIIVAIGEEDIPFVKEKIRVFRDEINKELTDRIKDRGASKVYTLAIQFFDLLKTTRS